LIVVDASLFIAWLLNEPRHAEQDAVWDLLVADTAFVPDQWPNEIANALRRAVRTKRIQPAEIALIVERISPFDIEFAGPTPLDEIGRLANEALDHGLSAYDMTYVRLARDRQLPLATLDRAMRRAAIALNIPLLPPATK
jgi:predicted nucleic acid-binding protein